MPVDEQLIKGMPAVERREYLAEALANEINLPADCVRCGGRMYGLERSRAGVYNGKYGSLCNACQTTMEDRSIDPKPQ